MLKKIERAQQLLKKEEAVFPYHAGNTASFCFAAAAESKMHF